MAWFRLEGRGAFHHKVLAAGNEAYGAWCRAGQWSSDQLTDGFVPASVAEQIAKPKVWDKLIASGLLHEADGGYQIHDFLDWNPSSEQEREKREAMRERRREAGKVGGKRSGEVRRGEANAKQTRSKDEANAKQSASSPGEANAKQNEAPNPNPNPNPRRSVSSAPARTHARTHEDEDLEEPGATTVQGMALAALRGNPTFQKLAGEGLRLEECALNLAAASADAVINGTVGSEASAERVLVAIQEVAAKVRATAATSQPWGPKMVSEKLVSFAATNLRKKPSVWAEERRRRGEGGSHPQVARAFGPGSPVADADAPEVEPWRIRTDLAPPPPPKAVRRGAMAGQGPMAATMAGLVPEAAGAAPAPTDGGET